MVGNGKRSPEKQEKRVKSGKSHMASKEGQRSINYTGSRLEQDKTHENIPTKLS